MREVIKVKIGVKTEPYSNTRVSHRSVYAWREGQVRAQLVRLLTASQGERLHRKPALPAP